MQGKMILPLGGKPGIVRFSRSFKILDVNEQFCGEQGKEESYFRGRDLFEFIRKPYHDRVHELSKMVAETQTNALVMSEGYDIKKQKWVGVRCLLKPVLSRINRETIEFKAMGWRV